MWNRYVDAFAQLGSGGQTGTNTLLPTLYIKSIVNAVCERADSHQIHLGLDRVITAGLNNCRF